VPVAPQSADEMLRLIERSELVTLEKIDEHLNGRKPPSAALPFAQWLVKKGLLTAFQADHLLQGKSRGFYLGNYRVLHRLGDGATAGVFLCEHKFMNNRVAVKVLTQQLSVDGNSLTRFRREAQAAAALDHPNIVRTIDFDENQGRHFLVMEYVEGVTLDQWWKTNPSAPIGAYVDFIRQAALGLQHIHESDLIHRDIKPSNLLLDQQGTVKILDLGLARFTDDRHDGLTEMQGANIIGTVDFMSPEQTDGRKELDIRTDIYSLGATFYYLLTQGRVPFPMANVGAKMIAIQFQEPQAIVEFQPDVDPLLQKIVARMMAKDPAKRFQTPKEAVAVLQGWLDHAGKKKEVSKETTVASGLTLTTQKVNRIPTTAPATQNREASQPTRRGALKWVLRVAAFLFVAGTLIVLKPWGLVPKAAANTANSTK
jgi:eukaryotic-like serine/threonine-protein kinase